MNNNKSLLTVLIVISAINLLLTTWLVFQPHSQPGSNNEMNHARSLPAELSAQKRQALFEQVKKLYNAEDIDGLYLLFSPDVRVQLSKAEFDSTIRKLKATFNNIEDGAYSNYEFVGRQGGKAYYSLNYVVRFPKSSISEKGSLKIGLTVAEGNVGIYGIYLNSLAQ